LNLPKLPDELQYPHHLTKYPFSYRILCSIEKPDPVDQAMIKS
jgi:hypothetical protein